MVFQEAACHRGVAFNELPGCAFEDQASSVLSGAGSHVDDPISLADDIQVVLDDDDGAVVILVRTQFNFFSSLFFVLLKAVNSHSESNPFQKTRILVEVIRRQIKNVISP